MQIYRDIAYNEEQKLDIYVPEKESFNLLVYFHGGGLESGSKEAAGCFARYLASKGYGVVSANYRLYPEANYPDFIDDAAEAVAWVFSHIGEYGKCENIFVGGSSAGAYLSMMLCFDIHYLGKYGIAPTDIAGYIHDAGQPTCHYNVLRERGIDRRRVITDESAPLFHVGTSSGYSPMLFIVSDNDMVNRYEQTMLMISTLKHFGNENVSLRVMHGTHCSYTGSTDENGYSIFGKVIEEYISSLK